MSTSKVYSWNTTSHWKEVPKRGSHKRPLRSVEKDCGAELRGFHWSKIGWFEDHLRMTAVDWSLSSIFVSMSDIIYLQIRFIWCSIVHAQSFSHVQLFAAPWTVARQASLSMGFSGQEYWNKLSFATANIRNKLFLN